MPGIAHKVADLHQSARNLIVKAIECYGGDTTVLETIQTPLAQAYRTNWTQGVMDSRLEDQRLAKEGMSPTTSCSGNSSLHTLAAAAYHVQESASPQLEDTSRFAPAAITEVARNQILGDRGLQTSLSYQISSNPPEIPHTDALGTTWNRDQSDQSLWEGNLEGNLGLSECQITHAQGHFQDPQMSARACAAAIPELTDTWRNDLYSSWFSECVQDFC